MFSQNTNNKLIIPYIEYVLNVFKNTNYKAITFNNGYDLNVFLEHQLRGDYF